MAIKILDNETTEKRDTKISAKESTEEYIDKSDWRIAANSNTGYSHAALVNTLAGKVVANYWLDQVYSKKEGDAHRNGDYHIHDLDNLAAYCFTKDTKVKTVEYGDISIEELLAKNVESFTVKSTDLEAVGKYELKVEEDITEEDKVFFYKHFMNKTARNLRKTRENAELVAVEFEDGLVVKCTPDHKFLTATTMVAEEYTPYMVFAWDVAEMLKKGDKIVSVNGCTKVIKEVTKLPNREDVYCMEVEDTHCFALENGAVVHNCCGHDLQKLLNEGFNGVAGRVGSKAPKHIREALYQMANFIGILQAEWAGAQAFSSFDTYLAPLVFFDMNYGTLNFDELKKAVRNFVFNLNVPSRWGQCVPSTYKALKADGTWVSKDELKVGDEIYVFDTERQVMTHDTIVRVNEYDAPEVMHKYVATPDDTLGELSFLVTTNHKVLHNLGSGKYTLADSVDLLGKFDVHIPQIVGKNVHTFINREVKIEEVAPITDKVWCPTTNTGTFVCMTDEGYVFLTGNSPFSNITIDLKCPNDLKDRNPMREHKPFFVSIYEEYKETLDKVRSAIKEQGIGVMPEGITEKEMEVFMSWEILMQSAEERLKDFDEYTEDMDEETVCYSLCYKHFDKEMKLITKAYYEVMNEGDAFGLPFTFPIPTINIGEDFDWDNPEYDVIWDNTAKYGSSYFQNFIGSQYLRDENGELTIRDENAYSPNDVRSMCPLTFDTKVVARSGQDASFRKIGEMYHTAKNKGTKYECFYNGEWVKCSVIRVEPQTIHRITLANNRTYSMGELHEQPICRNGETMNVMARDIRVGDLIPFNTSVVDAGGTNSSYELGYALGAYLGDGSHDGSETITYSLCADEKDDETEKVLRKFWEGNGFHTRVKIEGRLRRLVVTGNAFSLISKFVAGKTALDKGIVANILNQSVDMRRGIVDGYIATDGQRANGRISTSSERMVDDLVMLFNSLGIKAYKSFTDTREGRLGEAPNMTVSHITEKQNFKGKYATIDGQLYWYVTDIEVNSNTNTPLYCLVTESEEHLFTLGDGLITHNCRLQLDKRALRKRGGGLFGSDSQTGCYDDKTEVMTTKGWKFFKDLTLDDEFYTLNNNRGIEVHKANQLFVYDWNGDMCHFKNKTVDLLVTPNHNMLLTHNSNDRFRFKKAEDCNHTFNMPLVGNWDAPDVEYHIVRASEQANVRSKSYEDIKVKMDTWLKFLGLFLSEGYVRGSKGGDVMGSFRYGVGITQKKEQNIGIIDEVMNEMPFNVNRRVTKDGAVQWDIGSKQLWEELSPLGCSWNKYIPEYVFGCSARQLRLLYDYMMLGDGHIRKSHKQSTYYTSSKRMADDFQHLLMLIGRGSSLKKDNRQRLSKTIRGREIKRKHDFYEVGAHYSKNRNVHDGYVREHYEGKVYCVEVPNHTLYVRRNGKCVWCGNSIGVVTINLARIGYNFKGDKKAYLKQLYKLMDMAKSTLEKKRAFVTEMVKRGLYPYTRRYVNSALNGFTTYFSTIGVNGMNESIRNFTNDEHDITDEWGQEFAKDVMAKIRERLLQYQEDTGNLYNAEASPGEGTTYRFAKEDAKRFGDKEVHYIICEKHGKVEVSIEDGTTEVECPLCVAEKNNG